jgi:TonB family protein
MFQGIHPLFFVRGFWGRAENFIILRHLFSYFPASRTDNGKRYRAIYISGMGGKSAPKDIYLNVFIDKNGNGAFERQEFEHFVLALPRDGVQPFRTDAEIQPVFEIHKNKIYRVFKKELRYKPGLAGKMVVKFTVLPSGKATRAHVVSSTLKNVGFEKKILTLIESFNFGPKRAPNVIIQYPIEFLPTS